MVPKQTLVWVLGLLFRSLAEGGRAALGAMLMEMIFLIAGMRLVQN